VSKIKDYLLSKYEEGTICDECGEIHDEENEVMTIKEEGQQMKEVCEMCGIEGEGASAWGGWCHDCDNQLGDVTGV
jgi:hypothetical protein